ncbi:tyrosine-protein phosphatase [Cellulomonas sp. P22]|uniref:tyrosine-protein phosphatase n=1 Tax=Cellulomonas sp. P22 TaxID=3373189 RepID=UPI003790614A
MLDRDTRWGGFRNARDLGGLPLRGGGLTRSGAVVRSASVDAVTDVGWANAWEDGFRTVIDLRDGPTSTAPGPADRFDRLLVPLDDSGDTAFWSDVRAQGIDGTPLYVRPFLERKADRCATVVAAVAAARPGGVIIHCAAGRDRTGIVALLLLALAGVEPEAIVEDYSLSSSRLGPLFAELGRPDEAPAIERLMRRRGVTTRDVLLQTLAETDVAGLLIGAGVTPDTLSAARERLL